MNKVTCEIPATVSIRVRSSVSGRSLFGKTGKKFTLEKSAFNCAKQANGRLSESTSGLPNRYTFMGYSIASMTSPEGLREISRFALSPNKLNLCGLDSAQGRLYKCATTGESEGIEDELSHGFPHLNSFLNTIAHVHGLPPFTPEVVDAYWIGNDLSGGATLDDYEFLIEQYRAQGAEGEFLDELIRRVPKKFVPTHNFQVIHVGVLEASGVLSRDLPLVNQCMIRSGRVRSIDLDKNTLSLSTQALVDQGGFQLRPATQTVRFDPQLVIDPEIGQEVAIHWGWAVRSLDQSEAASLAIWTQEVIKSL